MAAAPLIAHAAPLRLVGFFAPWDNASLTSFRQHASQLEAVVPASISATGGEHKIAVAPGSGLQSAMASVTHPPKLWLMVQNALLGEWNGSGTASLLHDRAASASLLDQLEAEVAKEKGAGLVVDFEDLPPSAQSDFLAFIAAAKLRCRAHGWTIAVTAPPADPNWNLPALGSLADRVILMVYGEHWQTGSPGPIASDPWFTSVLSRVLKQLPSGRVTVALASYAYDWPASGPAAILSIDQAEALAAQKGVRPERDLVSGSAHFSYSVDGVQHTVWLSDATVVRQELAIGRAAGARSFALWRLGTEDPAIWHSTELGSGL
jgi:spore germination protein YaaH